MIGRSSLAGFLIVVGLVLIEVVFGMIGALREAGVEIAALLYPGAAIAFALGNQRIDDLDFVGIVFVLNWLIYSAVSLGWLQVYRRITMRRRRGAGTNC